MVQCVAATARLGAPTSRLHCVMATRYTYILLNNKDLDTLSNLHAKSTFFEKPKRLCKLTRQILLLMKNTERFGVFLSNNYTSASDDMNMNYYYFAKLAQCNKLQDIGSIKRYSKWINLEWKKEKHGEV